MWTKAKCEQLLNIPVYVGDKWCCREKRMSLTKEAPKTANSQDR